MLQKSSQSTKKECIVRRRKPLIAGAGVKHRLNCLSTLSTLHSHTSSCSIKRNRNLSMSTSMSKPTKNTSKKRQEQYVIKLANQELVHQISKSGSIVLKGGEEEEDLQNLTLQQKVKIIFILLMIPSAMVVFFGNNKFKSESSNTIIPNLPPQHLAAMGGYGGGFGGGFGGGGGGRSHFHDHSRRQLDRETIRDHLDRLDPRIRKHVQNSGGSRRRERSTDENEPYHHINNEMAHENMNTEDIEKLDHKARPTDQSKLELTNFEEQNREDVYQRLLHEDIDSDFMQNLVSNHKDFEKQIEKNINKIKLNIKGSAAQTSTQKSIPLSEDIELGFKVILLWTPFSGSLDLVAKGSEAFINSKCPINKCTLTSDKLYTNQSDAIVFNARNIVKNEMPNMRSPNQTWIFFSSEWPHNFSINHFNNLSNVFNWSWTYRTDSDIVYGYRNVEQLMSDDINRNNNQFNAFDVWRRKSKMIFWPLNSCETHNKSQTYINELKKHIDIDIYGKCGNNSCPQTSSEENNDNEDCFKTLGEQYLFAIVLENSFCSDYMSDRVFSALEHNIIPIVMSDANYSRLMPPNSVINAINYSSPKDFADYVLDIGADFNKYKTFFEWKRQYQVNYRRNDLCQLCSKLHEEQNQHKSYQDIKSWWLDESKCKQSNT